MKIVKYLFVNDTRSKNPLCDAGRRNVSDFRYNITVEPETKWRESGSESRTELLNQLYQLIRLHRHYPDAKILGLSEIDLSSAYAPIKVSPWMNQLRREMSDLT